MYRSPNQEELITMQIQELKINRTYSISPSLYEQFKSVANKDMRKLSNIIEQSIKRYVQSKT